MKFGKNIGSFFFKTKFYFGTLLVALIGLSKPISAHTMHYRCESGINERNCRRIALEFFNSQQCAPSRNISVTRDRASNTSVVEIQTSRCRYIGANDTCASGYERVNATTSENSNEYPFCRRGGQQNTLFFECGNSSNIQACQRQSDRMFAQQGCRVNNSRCVRVAVRNSVECRYQSTNCSVAMSENNCRDNQATYRRVDVNGLYYPLCIVEQQNTEIALPANAPPVNPVDQG